MTAFTLPRSGFWTLDFFPERVFLDGVLFEKARWRQPYEGVVEQYREATERNSRHLKVYENGVWQIDHVDGENPDRGNPIKHFFEDHPYGGAAAVGLVVLGLLYLANKL